MLSEPLNANSRPNSDVLSPWMNAADLMGRSRGMWLIDFRGMTLEEAACYESPFEHLKSQIACERLETIAKGKEWHLRDSWWLHRRPGSDMREAVRILKRFVATPRVAKHRVFAWLEAGMLPDNQLYIFARDDDYFLGVLQSRLHEVWARAQGTQLREVESGFRYTPTSTFETFPFPWGPGKEPQDNPLVQAIALAASELVTKRDAWLNPPDAKPETLRKRTLTNLYNERPSWLVDAHRKLDEAVFAAYGWPPTLTNAEVLERLLALNHQRAAIQENGGG
jgi:hypothetical protein